MDDFVCDFERQPGEEKIKEDEPQIDAMLMAIPQARALRGRGGRGGVPLRLKQERTLPK